MNLLKNDHAQRKLALLAILISVPAFSFAQHKSSGGGAPHPSAPAHASAPAQHAPAPHNTGSMGRPANQGGRPASTMGNHTGNTVGNRPGGTTGNHPGNSTMGNHPGNTMGNRPGNSTASHPGSSTMGHPGNNNAGRPGATAGNHSATGGAGAGTAGPNPMSRSVGPTGGHAGNATAGHAAMNRTPPGKQVSLKGGGTASIRPNGQSPSRSTATACRSNTECTAAGRLVSTHNGARVVTATGRSGGYVPAQLYLRNGKHVCIAHVRGQQRQLHECLSFLRVRRGDTAVTTAMLPRITTTRFTTDGLITRGRRRCITAGDGGGRAVVWVLRSVLCSVSGLSFGGVLVDGLSACRQPASGL